MRKIIRLFFLFLFMTACSPNNNKTLKVLFIAKTSNSDYHQLVIRGAENQARQMGIIMDVVAPEKEDDYETQREYLISVSESKKYNSILLAPNHSNQLINQIRDICNAGMSVLIVDTALDESNHNLINCNCGYVGTDNFLGGKLAARYIKKMLKQGNIVLVRGVHTHKTSIDREKGFMSEFEGSGKFNIISILPGVWDYNIAKTEYEKFVLKDKLKIDAVFAYNDPMIMGVSKYYEKEKTRPILVGYDGGLEVQQAILKNKVDASVVQTPEIMGMMAVKRLVSCNMSKEKNIFLTPVTLITASRKLTTMEFLD